MSADSFAVERARIDASTRLPVLVWFASALFWLVFGSLAALAASLKMHTPEFLGASQALTFGFIRPIHLNTVVYGWSSMAGIGTLLWLIPRLARTMLVFPKLLVFSAIVWNIGVLAGTVGLFLGMTTGIEWLEFPPFVPPILTFALLIVTFCGFATFRQRNERHVYVTLWYVLGALVWMPAVYVIAVTLCVYQPAPGVVQAATNWWFAHNVLGLWLTPIGVGAAYYIIPKVLGRPIYSYYLSIVGFWALALFYSWAGMHHLIGGPLPTWLVSASVVGSIMMFIPVLAVALNHHMTMVGNFHHLRYSPTLRFVVFGAMAYTVVSFQGSIEALRSFNVISHFTHYTISHAHLGLYGFFSMVMFGCMYYIVPRLTEWEWASAGLIRLHFWCSAIGITLYFVALTVGGWHQGMMAQDASIAHISQVEFTKPYLWARSVGGTLMLIGNLTFALLFTLNLMKLGKRRVGETTFRTPMKAVRVS